MQGSRITSEEKSTIGTYLFVGGLVLLALAGVVYFFFFTQNEVKQVTGFDPNRPVPADAVLKRRLGPETYAVVREARTQMPFQNKLYNDVRPGIYVDVITGEPLFSSVDKYDPGLGMPSFTKPISPDLIVESLDTRFDMQRTQLQAKRSNAYLGHRFDDPSSPTRQRYSINPSAVRFIPLGQMTPEGYGAYVPLVQK